MSLQSELTSFAQRVGQEFKNLRSEMGASQVPIFNTLAEAQAFETANPGKIALWFDSGYIPTTTFQDTFSTSGDVYTTTVNGVPWVAAMEAPFGVSTASMTMVAADGYATHGVGIVGSCAILEVGKTEMDIEVEYDLTNAAGGANRQVRICGRGDPYYTWADRSVMPVQAIVRETGVVQFEPWESSPGTWAQKQIGTGAPLTGTIRLTIFGNQARVYIDGVQVGSTETLNTPQLSGTKCGYLVRNGGRANKFKAVVGP